jgi:delta 1-pyrroline-5-carboxylate dehydrogenase
MAENCDPGTPLITETGGLNAMIVDSGSCRTRCARYLQSRRSSQQVNVVRRCIAYV